MALEPGATASITVTVGPEDTAAAMGSGDLPVLATPRAVALMERAAVAALAGSLPDGATTVGVRIAVDHIAATPIGGTVVATAEVTSVSGRTVHFDVMVGDGDAVVVRGEHVRVIVERDAFLSRLG